VRLLASRSGAPRPPPGGQRQEAGGPAISVVSFQDEEGRFGVRRVRRNIWAGDLNWPRPDAFTDARAMPSGIAVA